MKASPLRLTSAHAPQQKLRHQFPATRLVVPQICMTISSQIKKKTKNKKLIGQKKKQQNNPTHIFIFFL